VDDKTQVRQGRSALVVETGFCSECGERPENQDFGAALVIPQGRPLVIAAVADGVGGSKGGRVAAEMAVRGFLEGCHDAGIDSLKQVAVKTLEALNRWIFSVGQRDPALTEMATTFTGLLIAGRQGHLVHLGDSRLYRLRGESLDLLTRDHNAGPAMPNVLTRALGAEAEARIDYLAFQVEPHDRYLLCTDGVHGGLSDGELRADLGRRTAPDEVAREFVERALASRVGDNATALVVDVVAVPALERSDLVEAFANEVIRALPSPGDVVDGFRLETILGEGRYTRVLRALDEGSGKAVVLKFPKPLIGAEAPMREAFVRESWIASRVRSPFVGEVLTLDPERQSRLYLALPFYEGETLESRLARRPFLSLTAGLDIAQKLTKGVAALHRAGIIHRDIKPDNVILQPSQGPGSGSGLKLIDFGVARLKRDGEPADAAQPGTPSYLAPELFEGRPANEKSDQFALGVTIYRLFGARYPYGEIEPFSRPRFRAPVPLTQARPDLPSWLDRVIRRAIAVDPEERYHDVLEFMFELEHGADRASPIEVVRKPLYERNPLLFWKGVAALLLLALLAALFSIHHG